MKLKYAREIKVGILAVVCIFLLFFGFNYLKGVNIFSSIHSFHGVYTNIHGLELQAPVYIRGYKVGQVDNIDYDFTRDSSFTVDISIKRNINLPEGTRMALVSDGIMGGMAIELLLPATEVASKEDIAYLPTGATIPTTVVPGLLDGLQEAVIQPLSNTLASLDTLVGQLQAQLDNNHIESILSNADIAVADLQSSSKQLKQVMSHQVPSVITKLDTTMSDLQQVVTDVKAANIKATVARVDTALNNVNYLIADFRSPNGTVGMLLNDKGLYNHIDSAVVSVDSLLVDLKANPNKAAKGTIIEAQLDKGRGPVATVLVQNGTLKIGDPIVAGIAYGRVRAMMNDKGENVKTAGPSCPVEVLGFNEVPSAGDIMNVAEVSKKVAEERRNRIKAEQLKNLSKVSLEDLFSHIAEGEVKTLNIVVKADVHGSVEAVKQALEKLSNEEVRVKCIHGGVGAITESDVMFASASNAIVIGFNVRPDSGARNLAEQEKVDVRTYRIIYQAIEDVENAMKGMFKPVFKEVHLGTISVRNTFKVSSVGTIAGAYVQDGKVQRNAQVRVVRDGVVIHEGQIASLRRFKDDVREVAAGYECGIGIENFNDIHEGDVIEAYTMEEVKR